MNLFLAGYEDSVKEDLKGANALFSYYFQTKQNNSVDRFKEFILPAKLFIDSGAFTAWTQGVHIDVDDYISWINERSDDLYLFGQLDIIPSTLVGKNIDNKSFEESAKKTWDNFLYMYPKMKHPKKLLYTFHAGEPYYYLEQALEWRDSNGEPLEYIALGGLVGSTRKIRDKFLNDCYTIIKKSSNPYVKTHAFGMTDFKLMNKYPITSVDSTSWIMVGAMGQIMSDYGNIVVSDKQSNLSNHYLHLPESALLKLTEYIESKGFTLDELANSRNNRILYNGIYMQDAVSKIPNMTIDDFKISKKKLF